MYVLQMSSMWDTNNIVSDAVNEAHATTIIIYPSKKRQIQIRH